MPLWRAKPIVEDDSSMYEGALTMVVTVCIVIVVAVGVFLVLALSRRSADQWQRRLRDRKVELHLEREDAPSEAGGSPRMTSLDALLDSASTPSNAYFSADRLPGIAKLEAASERRGQRSGQSSDQDQ